MDNERLKFNLSVRGSKGIEMEEGWETGDMIVPGLLIKTVYHAGKGLFGGCIDRGQTRELRDYLNAVIDKWDSEGDDIKPNRD